MLESPEIRFSKVKEAKEVVLACLLNPRYKERPLSPETLAQAKAWEEEPEEIIDDLERQPHTYQSSAESHHQQSVVKQPALTLHRELNAEPATYSTTTSTQTTHHYAYRQGNQSLQDSGACCMRQMASHLGPGPSHNGPNSGAKPTPSSGLCRTGHGRFRANMHRMNLCVAPDCPCGAPEQTADHIINDCTKYQCPGLQALSTLNSEALAWLKDTSLVI
ncbi:unnamed protein product [Boreogadus saida]